LALIWLGFKVMIFLDVMLCRLARNCQCFQLSYLSDYTMSHPRGM